MALATTLFGITIRSLDDVLMRVARQLISMTWPSTSLVTVIQSPAPNGRSMLIARPEKTSASVFWRARPDNGRPTGGRRYGGDRLLEHGVHDATSATT